jgi:hypothetical protein
MDCLRFVEAHVEDGRPYNEVQEYACHGWYRHLGKWLDSGNRSRLDSHSVNILTQCLADFAEPQHYDCWINILIFKGGFLDNVHTKIMVVLGKV